MTLSGVEGDVPETTTVIVPTPAEVHAAVESALDQKPTWRTEEVDENRHLGQTAGRRRRRSLTSFLAALIAEHLVWRIKGVGLDQVHLGVSSSAAVDVLTLLTCRTHRSTETRWHREDLTFTHTHAGEDHPPDTTGMGHEVLQGSLQCSLWVWMAFSSFWIFVLILSRTPCSTLMLEGKVVSTTSLM